MVPAPAHMLQEIILLQQPYMDKHCRLAAECCDNSLQSAYRPHHSVETALLKVQNDILTALDQRKEVILVLLDFTSAFDTIEHMTLHGRLKQLYGLGGTVLEWLTSYLYNRSHVVKVRNSLSNSVTNNCGVPQGSVIGPMLYTMYSAPISKVIEAHGLSSMLYADDTQIYLTFRPQDQQEAIMKLNNCLTDIVSWAQKNMLKINAQKTELLHFSSRFNPSSSAASVMVDGFVVHETRIARNLGIHMDQHLQLREHIKKVCSSSMSALKRIAQIRHFMSTKTTMKLIHAFVTSRIDSCNALLFGIPEKDLSKLQTVQNCAARLIECAKRRDPVMPMLTRLHWLPVEKRIVYKIVLLCHKVLIHKSPTDLASVLTPYLPQRNLRSSSKQLLVVPTSSTCTYGDRAFASAAPILWNKLPDNLKTETDTSSFIKSLKTYLFLM